MLTRENVEKDLLGVGLLLTFSLSVRLLWFAGMVMGDDTAYVGQVLAHARTGSWPPAATHWHTRVGVTLPATLAVLALWPSPLAFMIWPLSASLIKVLICLRMAREFTAPRAAYLAAALLASFPLEIIYATHLFPDAIVSLFSTLSLWYWIRALRRDDARCYALSGAFFAAGYLCRETVLMEGPIYLALWALEGRIRRPRMAWVVLAPALVLLLECGVYAATAGDPFYRWNGIRAQQLDPEVVNVVNAPTTGGNFWTDPLLMVLASHELGPFLVFSLVVAPYALRNWPPLRPVSAWLLSGFAWLCYGTVVPTRWVLLQRDPRYLGVLTVPCVILLAHALMRMDRRLRWPIAAALIGSGILAAGLDQGAAIRWPHRRFLATPYAQRATLEPTEYLGARWTLGLAEPPNFDCAGDLGVGSLVRALSALEGTRLRPHRKADYLVIAPDRRPKLLDELREEGWVEEAEIPGRATGTRRAVAGLLALVPSQRERADRIAHPPGLVVLVNPRSPRPTPRSGDRERSGEARPDEGPSRGTRSPAPPPQIQDVGP